MSDAPKYIDHSGRAWAKKPEPLYGGTPTRSWWYANVWFQHTDDENYQPLLVRVATKELAQILLDRYTGAPRDRVHELMRQIERWEQAAKEAEARNPIPAPPRWITERGPDGKIAIPPHLDEQRHTADPFDF
jgi:hypothetical protein